MNAPNEIAAASPDMFADGLWLPIAEIARIKGVSRQTIGEKVTRLEAEGKIETRPGKGGTRLVNLAQYNLVLNEVGDIAREIGAETRRDDDDAAAPAGDPTFRDAQAREKKYKADLAELEVRQRLGELVDVTRLSAAVSQAAEIIVGVMERMPQSADAIAAAVAKDGPAGARAIVKQLVRSQRVAMADALRKMVADINGDDAAKRLRIGDEAGKRWGDLDPAEWAGSDHA